MPSVVTATHSSQKKLFHPRPLVKIQYCWEPPDRDQESRARPQTQMSPVCFESCVWLSVSINSSQHSQGYPLG